MKSEDELVPKIVIFLGILRFRRLLTILLWNRPDISYITHITKQDFSILLSPAVDQKDYPVDSHDEVDMVHDALK